jgi:TolB-like protein
MKIFLPRSHLAFLDLFLSRFLGRFFGLVLSLVFCSSCAYQLGVTGRRFPGGYSTVEIPIFKNLSQEPGAEIAFTNSLIQEVERNKIARVVDSSHQPGAPLVVRGEISSIQSLASAPVQKTEQNPYLPEGAVIASVYRVVVTAQISVVEKNSGKVLWKSSFQGESSYAAPQVTIARLNSVNPLYNLSSRRRIIEIIARDMMVEAHDRMTENF